MTDRSLPLPELPYDALRQGLTAHTDCLPPKHPVQLIQEKDGEREKYRTMREVYGLALPARMHIEKQILQKRGRLPPLTESNFGVEVYFGKTEAFTSESYLGLAELSEKFPPDVHSQMEEAYGLGTKTAKRGIL